MFNEGDRIALTDGSAFGTVLETYDGYVCAELDNGVEIEYKAGQVMAEAAYIKQAEEARATANQVKSGQISLYITNPSRRDLRAATYVVCKLREKMQHLLTLAQEKAGANSDDFGVIRALTDLTGTPMIVWLGAGEDSSKFSDQLLTEVLRKTLLNSVLNQTGLISDLIITQVQAELKAWREDKS